MYAIAIQLPIISYFWGSNVRKLSILNCFDPAAFLIVDFLFKWNCELENINNQCHLKIYKITFDKAIVIISDILNNSSYAIDEETINVINLVCKQFNLSPKKTM